MAWSFKADMYWRQSSAWINALVTRSFKHCTAFSEFSSYLKSWFQRKTRIKLVWGRLHLIAHYIFELLSKQQLWTPPKGWTYIWYMSWQISGCVIVLSFGTFHMWNYSTAIKEANLSYLKFIRIFTPYLSRPEHAGLWYLIYVFQIVPNYISFLQFDSKYLLVRQKPKT